MVKRVTSVQPGDPSIICPECGTEVKLTESLAAPLVESVKSEYEGRLAKLNDEITLRESAVSEKTAELRNREKKLEEQIASQVDERVAAEKKSLIESEAKRAREAVAAEMEERAAALRELEDAVKSRDEKLAEAQKAQADYLRMKRELEEARGELELEIQKRVSDELTDLRLKARKDAEELLNLKISEKDQTILSMQKTIEELKRKADQSSQQLQGEVLEIELEELLRNKFLFDSIEPVPKGQHGGDIIHRVRSNCGQDCGAILWETKRTKNWSDGWLVKLRNDRREAKADIAVIASQTLPAGIDTFGFLDGVWVCSRKDVEPMAFVLRHVLLEVNAARQASEGIKTKAEMIYQYLTGPRFKMRIEAIHEAFKTMRDDLEREKKLILKQWAKREQQIGNVLEATVGMYGDLQGIAGSNIQEIEGMELPALDE